MSQSRLTGWLSTDDKIKLFREQQRERNIKEAPKSCANKNCKARPTHGMVDKFKLRGEKHAKSYMVKGYSCNHHRSLDNNHHVNCKRIARYQKVIEIDGKVTFKRYCTAHTFSKTSPTVSLIKYQLL